MMFSFLVFSVLKLYLFAACLSLSHSLTVQLEYLGLHLPKGRGGDPKLELKVPPPLPHSQHPT